MGESFRNGVAGNPKGGVSRMKLGRTPTKISDGQNKWKFPRHWIPPLKWYWSQVGMSRESNAETMKDTSGVEMALDFEIATHVVLAGTLHSKSKGKARSAADHDGKVAERVSRRAYNFAAASRKILKICVNVSFLQATSISILTSF